MDSGDPLFQDLPENWKIKMIHSHAMPQEDDGLWFNCEIEIEGQEEN